MMPMEDESQTFSGAWDHLNPESQREWQDVMRKEFNYTKNNRYRGRHLRFMPHNHKCIKTNGFQNYAQW